MCACVAQLCLQHNAGNFMDPRALHTQQKLYATLTQPCSMHTQEVKSRFLGLPRDCAQTSLALHSCRACLLHRYTHRASWGAVGLGPDTQWERKSTSTVASHIIFGAKHKYQTLLATCSRMMRITLATGSPDVPAAVATRFQRPRNGRRPQISPTQPTPMQEDSNI